MLLLYLRPGKPHVSWNGPPAAAGATKQSPPHARTTCVSALLAEAPRIRMNAAPEDGELVAMTLQGNSEAFASLVERYDRAVYHLSCRMLRDVEDARDATQEAFFKAFRSLRTFRAGAKFSTWIFAIAYHACCDRLARRKHDAGDELPDRADPARDRSRRRSPSTRPRACGARSTRFRKSTAQSSHSFICRAGNTRRSPAFSACRWVR